MDLQVIEFSSTEHLEMIALRNKMLREPIGLAISFEDAASEKDDILLGAFNEGELTGCCLLTRRRHDTIQLRQMCVADNYQNKGVGKALLEFAEQTALNARYKIMTMHARATAVEFYKSVGYKVEGEQFIEVTLPHYSMVKVL